MIGKNSEAPAQESALAGPPTVTVHGTSARGPLAGPAATIPIPQTRINLINTSADPVSIADLRLDPLQAQTSGNAVPSSLTVHAATRDLAAGEALLLTISGDLPATPGVYITTLRVTPLAGPPLAIPVQLRVAARATWGIACTLLGLSFIGLLNTLDGESGVQGELRRVLLARQHAHEFLEQTPPPHARAIQVTAIDQQLEAAIASLQKPRNLSFVDHRRIDAQEHLNSATQMLADLRKALSGIPPGSIEVKDVAEEWKQLSNHFGILKQYLVASPVRGASLEQRLTAFDAWAAQRLLGPPITFYTNEFTYQVNRVQLLASAGRVQEAADGARSVRRWMQRAADVVNTQSRLLLFFVQQSANDLSAVFRIRQRVAKAAMSPEMRAEILRSLNTTASLLSEPLTWPARHTVSKRIRDTFSTTLAAESTAVIERAKAMKAQEAREDSIDQVQAVIDAGAKLKRGTDGKLDPSERTPFVRRVIAAWRARLATFPEPNPAAILAELDKLEAAVESNDLDAMTSHFRGTMDQWATYSTARAQAMILRTYAPFCMRIRDDAFIDLEATQQMMRRLEIRPDMRKWEDQLDNLRRSLGATPDREQDMSQDCLRILFELTGKARDLSSQVYSAMWNETAMPDAAKHELAKDLGSDLTPEALRSLISDVRPLRINVGTPEGERYAGRTIELKIDNLDRAWGSGVKLMVEFGDGQRATVSVEDLHKNQQLSHTYTEAKSFTLAVVAAEAFRPGTMQAVGKSLGEGGLQRLTISPSPISTARQIADAFFDIRFALGLAVASLIYFWRFQASKMVFGANPFDYAQALALGLAVSVAVNDLPKSFEAFLK